MTGADETLLVAAKLGDREALATLLERHAPAVRGALRIHPRWQSLLEADDVMQVTYFEAFERIGVFHSDAASFPRWLMRIAQRNLIDALRMLKGKKRLPAGGTFTVPDGADPLAWLDQLTAGTGTTPTRHLSRQEARRILESTIDRLPADYARVLRGVFFDGQAVEALAREMGRRPGAVYLLRLRALRRLRELLGSGSLFFSQSA
jgi:RNA polymerase sigma factor (sigma-70 family)